MRLKPGFALLKTAISVRSSHVLSFTCVFHHVIYVLHALGGGNTLLFYMHVLRWGSQATEKIRQRPGLNQRTPIVAVTANAMKGDREKVRPDCHGSFNFKGRVGREEEEHNGKKK